MTDDDAQFEALMAEWKAEMAKWPRIKRWSNISLALIISAAVLGQLDRWLFPKSDMTLWQWVILPAWGIGMAVAGIWMTLELRSSRRMQSIFDRQSVMFDTWVAGNRLPPSPSASSSGSSSSRHG
jgi:uncharacterized membrane protein YcjF (UPF0283 family)